MKYLFIICILFWNLTGITVAAPDKAQVMELLEGRYWKLDVESFQLLGDDTDKVLIEIGGDTSLINYRSEAHPSDRQSRDQLVRWLLPEKT